MFFTRGIVSELRYRAAIRFSITGDLRFISHHDTMRLFERAIMRSGLPVRFSEGFNPRPRLSLPLPRAVGVATRADVLVVELTEPCEPDVILARLGAQMPRGVDLLSAHTLEGNASLQPVAVTCELPLEADQIPQVRQRIADLLGADRWMVTRDAESACTQTGGAAIDLRPFLIDAGISGCGVRWTVRVTNAGSVRPAEFLDAIGLDGRAMLHRVVRIDVEWSQEPGGAADLVAAAETSRT